MDWVERLLFFAAEEETAGTRPPGIFGGAHVIGGGLIGCEWDGGKGVSSVPERGTNESFITVERVKKTITFAANA